MARPARRRRTATPESLPAGLWLVCLIQQTGGGRLKVKNHAHEDRCDSLILLLVSIRKPVISSTTSDRILYSRVVVNLPLAAAGGISFWGHRFGHSADGRRPCHSFWRDMSLVQRLPVQV